MIWVSIYGLSEPNQVHINSKQEPQLRKFKGTKGTEFRLRGRSEFSPLSARSNPSPKCSCYGLRGKWSVAGLQSLSMTALVSFTTTIGHHDRDVPEYMG